MVTNDELRSLLDAAGPLRPVLTMTVDGSDILLRVFTPEEANLTVAAVGEIERVLDDLDAAEQTMKSRLAIFEVAAKISREALKTATDRTDELEAELALISRNSQDQTISHDPSAEVALEAISAAVGCPGWDDPAEVVMAVVKMVGDRKLISSP